MPKVWCRDGEHQFSFEPDESVCWSTHRLAQHRASDKFKSYDDDTKSGVQISARFRDGHRPDPLAGLGLHLPTDE